MIYFSDLYKNETKVKKNKIFYDFFENSLDFLLQDQKKLSELQKRFLIIKLANAYIHFGFLIFSDISCQLISYYMNQEAGIEEDFCQEIIYSIKRILRHECLDETNNSYYYTEEELNENFLIDFLKRISCSTDKENHEFSLDIFSGCLLKETRKIFESAFNSENFKIDNSYKKNLEKVEKNFSYYHDLFLGLNKIINEIKNTPNCLLVWRIINFQFTPMHKTNQVFFIKDIQPEQLQQIEELGLILLIFVKHSIISLNGQISFKEFTILELIEAIKTTVNDDKKNNFVNNFYLKFNIDDINSDKYLKILDFGKELGVIYHTPFSKKNSFFALTDKGMHIMRPFNTVS